MLKKDHLLFSTVTNFAPIVELEIRQKSMSQGQLPPGITSTKHSEVLLQQISGKKPKPKDTKNGKIFGINRKAFIVIVISSVIIVLIAILMCVVCCK